MLQRFPLQEVYAPETKYSSSMVLRLQGATQPSKNRLQMCLKFDYGCCRDLRY